MNSIVVTPDRPRITAETRPSVRLTRRGRTVVLLAAVAMLAVLAITLGSATTATIDTGDLEATRTVEVEAGVTVWDLAAEANPDGDIRATVDAIVQLNSLSDVGSLRPGAEIAVPVLR